VVKLLRAYGEWLGVRRRWKTWEPAICPGELATKLRSWDLWMGKPGPSGSSAP